jgi:16S rRNA (uracil1498-N3)-methyltransferase
VSAPVFVVDPARLSAGLVVLDGAEGRHAATVTRLVAGEPVVLVDGAGRRGEGVVVSASRDVVEVDVTAVEEVGAPQPRFVVVQALPKGDRGELAVETMTEVGVDVVVPWAAARCVTRWRADRADKAVAKWRTSSRTAAKQSRRSRFPEVTGLATTAEVGRLLSGAALGVVLHESATRPLAGVTLPAAGDVVLVVGPEGGVTDEELGSFREAGAATYRLGETVLRTSTAGVAALSVLSASSRWR